MFSTQSPLGISAAGLYLLVMAACLAAALTGKSRRQPSGHFRQWLLILGVFAAMLALRMFDLEEGFRQITRGSLRSDGTYEMRREVQRPLAAGLIVAFATVAFASVYRFARQGGGKRNMTVGVAAGAALTMTGLVGLRIVSLHQIDAALYGPLKLNWVIDVGASLTVLGAAIYYLHLIKRRK